LKKTMVWTLSLVMVMLLAGCGSAEAATDSTVVPTVAVTEATNEPTETATVTTVETTAAETMVVQITTLAVPVDYTANMDNVIIYADSTRVVKQGALKKGATVTITGTADKYGVTAEGYFVNLHLMTIVVPATPTPAETTAVTAETTKVPTATKAPSAPATAKETAAPIVTTAAPAATTAAPVVPVTSLSASQVESLIWNQVEAARSGMTTNHNDTLSARSCSNANRLYVGHTGNNGDAESCCDLGTGGIGNWTCALYGNQVSYDTLEECAAAAGNYLVTVHVPTMATDSTYTEFGVGVVKEENGGIITYYVYVSCATPEDFQWQIDQGWYA